MNDDTIEAYGHAGILDLFAVLPFCCGEVNVVSLPGEWRQAGVEPRCGDAVDAASLVLFARFLPGWIRPGALGSTASVALSAQLN